MSGAEHDGARILAMQRYPVKGLAADHLNKAHISSDSCLMRDRAYGITMASHIDSGAPGKWQARSRFMQLETAEKLAKLAIEFDEDGDVLRILRNGKQVARGSLQQKIGRQLLEQFLAAYLGPTVIGAPHLIAADSHFADEPENYISILNLATIRDIARIMGQPVDPLRFRANIHIDGIDAWAEQNWPGQVISIAGKAAFDVIAPINRAAEISIDPTTAQRDMNILHSLTNTYGHGTCGVYIRAKTDVELAIGQTMTVSA